MVAVIDDKEIYECARLLLKEHGDDAESIAEMKHDARLKEADAEGSAVWKLVMAAIAELRQHRPGPDDPLN